MSLSIREENDKVLISFACSMPAKMRVYSVGKWNGIHSL